MANLDALERKAESWSQQSDDIDQVLKSVEILKTIAEQRKLVADTDKTSKEIRSEGKRWTRIASLAPAMAALITGLTFGITFLYQYKHDETISRQSEELQWRTALQKVDTTEPGQVEASALEMASFMNSRYASQSRLIAAALCSNIQDSRVFDFLMYQLYLDTDQNNQSDLLDVARSISIQLQKSYIDLPAADRSHETFVQFLKHPSVPDEAPVEAEHLQQGVETREWELDTVVSFLYALWTGPRHLNVSGLDFSGIIFWNDGFRAYDRIPNFDSATVSQSTAFIGKCSLGKLALRLSPRPLIECESVSPGRQP